MNLVNLSFYRFLPLQNLRERQADLRILGQRLSLKGTILLADEGVNAMVTGEHSNINEFKQYAENQFGALSYKEGIASEHSFHRFLVKIKKEIISVGDADLRPHEKTGKRLSAEELREWLAEGRDFHFIDTRNGYEVEVGTFRGAAHLNLECSREFASRAKAKINDWRGKPVVTFCTGGIRCEKASAVLLKHGLEDVYQLDGGILRYLEKNGAEHFEGNCFVYDWRLAVDAQLQPVPRSADGRNFGRHQMDQSDA